MSWRRILVAALVAALLSAWVLAMPQPAIGESRPRPPAANIVNGLPTQDFPAVGVLLFINDDGSLRTKCTATLIGCETVLTAAHCFCGEDLPADECISSGTREDNRRRTLFALQHAGPFTIKSVSIHPDYEFPLTGDVAVLKLDRPANGIPPARVNILGPVPIGSRGTIVGFGRTESGVNDSGVKRRGRITTVPCTDPYDGKLKDGLVCWQFEGPIGPAGDDSDIRPGDSGGPLFVEFGPEPRVAGVTSGRLLEATGSFDADVYTYRAWISQQAGLAELNQTGCGSLPQIGEAGARSVSFSGDVSGIAEDTYSVEIPPDTVEVRFALNGEDNVRGSNLSNQFGVVVNFGIPPTDRDYDCFDAPGGPYGFCAFINPTPGRWYVAVPAAGLGAYQLTVTSFSDAASPTATYTRTRTPTRIATVTPTRVRTGTAAPLPTATRTPSRPVPTTTTPATYSPTRPGTAPASGTPRATQAPGPCYGDCDDNGVVAINEVILGVNLALGAASAECRSFNPEGAVTIDKLVRAINAALFGCRRVVTATDTPGATDTVTPSVTGTQSATPTSTDPPRPTSTDAPTLTPTRANSSTATASETVTLSPTPLPTATHTATATAAPTMSETATAPPTLTPTCAPKSQLTPVEVARTNVPAGGYALSGGAEFDLEDLATTIEVGNECEEILVKVVLGVFSDRSDCQFPGCTVNVRLSTSGADDVVGVFAVGDANHVRSSELSSSYSHLAPGVHTFRVSTTRYGMTWIPSGYLEIRKR